VQKGLEIPIVKVNTHFILYIAAVAAAIIVFLQKSHFSIKTPRNPVLFFPNIFEI
jgi:hypothetical protein